MNHRNTRTSQSGLRRHVLATAVVLALAVTAAQAQLSSATIKGVVTAAPAGEVVLATNKANGNVYRTKTLANGGYVFTGLTPGSYEIQIGKSKSDLITVAVGETASVDLSVADSLDRVTVIGSGSRQDVKNSEASTGVSSRQIDTLPQTTRNFLAFADLAPGVRFTQDANGYTRIQGGAQGSDRVNVFIDGVSQKNDVSRGGVSGQNESRGNPFPQSAIGEYKVITQNYKAEFGSVSSTAITAVTKSGTNTLHGEVFIDYSAGGLIEYSPLETKAALNGVPRSPPKQSQYGASIGGAIKPDVLHFFLSYEGKDNTIPLQVAPTNLEGVTETPFITALKKKTTYTAERPFHEDLLFGKLNLVIDDNNRLELSGKFRREKDDSILISDTLGQGFISSPENVRSVKQQEQRLDLKYERFGADWLNEARVGYESSKFDPKSASTNPWVEYKRTNFAGIAMDGGAYNAEHKSQRGFLFQDDLTLSGIENHVVKIGAKLKAMSYDVSGTRNAVPHQFIFVDKNGVPNPLKSDEGNSEWFLTGAPLPPPWEPTSATGQPLTSANYKNKQYGFYLQDDWAISKKLELNVGVRYDYEDNAMNKGYVTPTAVVAALTGPDTRGGAPARQTYAQALALRGFSASDFISTGSNRKAFTGGIQPRLGLAYDIFGDKKSVVVAGVGRAYDRTTASKAQDEVVNNSIVGGEIWLLKNNMKVPYSDQFSLSLRQELGEWQTEAGYRQVRGHNEFFWFNGNTNADGAAFGGAPFDRRGGGPNGWGSVQLGDTVNQTNTQVVFLTARKPYTRTSGWGVGMTYTNSRARTTALEGGADSSANSQFSWNAGGGVPIWRNSTDVEKHRLVVDGSIDMPFDIRVGTKYTVGSGIPLNLHSCAAGWDACNFISESIKSFQQLDVMMSKDFKASWLGIGKATFRLDILNLFNTANYGTTYDNWVGGPSTPAKNRWGGDNANAGVATTMGGPMRTIKLGAAYAF